MTTKAIHTNGHLAIVSLDDLLAVARDDRPLVPVTVPEWGDRTVYLRAMSAAEKDEWVYWYGLDEPIESEMAPDQRKEYETRKKGRPVPTWRERLVGQQARLVARCLVTPDGERWLKDEDAAILYERNAAVVSRLYDRARELCGFTVAVAEEAAAKNASASPDAAPSSA